MRILDIREVTKPIASPIRNALSRFSAHETDQLRAVFRQPEIVVGTWRAAHEEDPTLSELEAREALTRLDPLWDELFPAEQERIVQLLVERVEVGTEGLDLRLRVDGLTGLVREMMTQLEQAA